MPRITLAGVRCDLAGPDGRRFPAVTGVDLEVDSGEFFVLVGPSGAGKTTVLRIIAGLEQPREGRVAFDGREMAGCPAEERDVAMAFQAPALFPHLTVGENLALGLRLSGVGSATVTERVAWAVELLELRGQEAKLPECISGGERQRVALGRALVRQPSVLLLDEPLAGVDAPLRRKLLGEVQSSVRLWGGTTVYVTHDQREALGLGCRLALMRRGEVAETGSPEDLYREPRTAFAAAFFGEPGMNLVPASVAPGGSDAWVVLDGTGLRLPLGHPGNLSAVAGAGRVLCGWRAHELALGEAGAWSGIVVAREFTGWGGLVRVEWGEVRTGVWVWVPGTVVPRVGAEVGLLPDLTRMRCFDGQSGTRLV